ncbi:hypothetical protein AABB24_036921 [Solanum stoloniferum]|uniref:Uncharacterized protein n=1 Tax=Solanum stoloniferum TaxID=62892 RepID=A0ABD2R2P3_9SOLN
MDCFSNNIQFFELGDKVKGSINLRDCKLKFFNSTVSIDVSALEFDDFEEAAKLFEALCHINSPYVTKPHGLRRYGLGEEKGIVIVEKVNPFSAWLNNYRKPNMWKIYGKSRTCLGLGFDFQKKFRQIMMGLKSIHKSSCRHGCLLDGVFLGTDDNIRLTNFRFWEVNDDSLKEDFRDFLSLVKNAIKKHPTPIDVKAQLAEVDQLTILFNHFLSKTPLECTDASWLYVPPIFWDSSQKRAFFNKLSSAFRMNRRLAQNYFVLQIGDWEKKITPTSPLHDVLCHLVPDDSSSRTNEWKMNDWYGEPQGIVVFVRNYCVHSYELVDPFNEIELIFPGITSLIFNELAVGLYSNKYLRCPYPPQTIQTLQVETVDSCGVIHQPDLLTTKSVLAYLEEEMSIWRN